MLMKGYLGVISSMRLHSEMDIQSVKLAWSILHSEFKAHVLPPPEGNDKGCKMNTFHYSSTLLKGR